MAYEHWQGDKGLWPQMRGSARIGIACDLVQICGGGFPIGVRD